MISIPIDANLLVATNWTFSNFVPRNPGWLDGDFNGWLEGRFVRQCGMFEGGMDPTATFEQAEHELHRGILVVTTPI